MQVAVEVSMYPLTPHYEEPILDFIRRLKAHPGLRIHTNELSTQLSGDYDAVLGVLQHEMRVSLADNKQKCSFVLKVLNVDIEPGTEVEVG